MQYKWTVLTNTTLGGLMASINMTIVMISLPTIFRGLNIDPTAPGQFTLLLWMLMGYSIVMATMLVTFGRLSDVFGRTKLYTIGFLIFTVGSILLSVIPGGSGINGAYMLIGLRMVQAIGGGLLMVNSTALITDAFSSKERGKALGINQISFIAGSLIGLILGGILAAYDWHMVFLVNVPFAVAGSLWSIFRLHEITKGQKVPIDLVGNVLLGGGLIFVSLGFTYSLVPYGSSSMGWGDPWVLSSFVIGIAMVVFFVFYERKAPYPLFNMKLFKIRPFAFGNFAGFLSSLGRGAVMFLTIIWLQGIYLPLNGYQYSQTPFWAGVYTLPMMAGFIILGPVSGMLTDRYGARLFATTGMVVAAVSLYLMTLLPANFSGSLWEFEGILLLNGVAMGLFASPNTTSIMNSLPPEDRGVGSGMRATLQNIGQTISMAVFFSITITIFSSNLPGSMESLGASLNLPAKLISMLVSIPPSGALFAAFLGINPISSLPASVLSQLPPSTVKLITSPTFFPNAIASSFMIGLREALYIAVIISLIAAFFSAMRGKRYVHGESEAMEGGIAIPGAAETDKETLPHAVAEPGSGGSK
ncbi:MAG: MFS transporter [Candidatus Thermoplasmatota archaeon]|jgi:EmrB/QacA subfamily drug resistance transporter|nr:MFS transporter [Candidatus Thermoplasmatota archaeon]